ncbi:hypothetical protein ACWC9T_11420 [Kitasatospora sp. NPDC001159]
MLPALPALLLFVGLLIGLFTPRDVRPDAFLATAMVAAAALLPLWGTVLTGVAACAVFVGLMVDFNALRDATAYSELANLVAIAVFAVCLNRLLGRRAHQLVQVRSVAEAAQLAVLHPVPRHLGHVTLESLYLAAAAEARRRRPGSAATCTRRYTPRTAYGCSSATYAARACSRCKQPQRSSAPSARLPTTRPTCPTSRAVWRRA